MNKNYYWLKLKKDFFYNKEIKKLKKLEKGYVYIVIYIKIQLYCISDEGYIKYEGTEKDLADQIALEIDENIDDVKAVLVFMEENNLIENTSEDEYFITKIPEVIGKETNAAIRMRKYRKRNDVTDKCNDVTDKCNDVHATRTKTNDVTGECNIVTQSKSKSKRVELELDTNIDKKENIKEKNTHTPPSEYPYKEIIDYLNKTCDTHYRYTPSKTRKLISARLKEGFVFDDFKTVIDKKYKNWKGTDMEKYLRPETLFGTKFEGYLNEKVGKYSSVDNDPGYNLDAVIGRI